MSEGQGRVQHPKRGMQGEAEPCYTGNDVGAYSGAHNESGEGEAAK